MTRTLHRLLPTVLAALLLSASVFLAPALASRAFLPMVRSDQAVVPSSIHMPVAYITVDIRPDSNGVLWLAAQAVSDEPGKPKRCQVYRQDSQALTFVLEEPKIYGACRWLVLYGVAYVYGPGRDVEVLTIRAVPGMVP